MNQMEIKCMLPPSNNAYLKYRVAYNPTPTVQAYPSSESIQFKKYMKKVVARAVEESGWKKPESNKYIHVSAIMYLPRTNCDSNNYWKVLLDSITETKLVWHDDNIVLEGTSRVYLDSQNPRVELSIIESSMIGVFESEYHLKIFKEKNCSLCSKSKCALMTKSLNNKFDADVDVGSNICFKIKRR